MVFDSPGRREVMDHRVGVAGDGRRWLRRRKSLCLSIIDRYASNSPSVCSASNASSPRAFSRSIFPSWSERRPRASRTWSSARARAISASSSMADVLALVTILQLGGWKAAARVSFGPTPAAWRYWPQCRALAERGRIRTSDTVLPVYRTEVRCLRPLCCSPRTIGHGQGFPRAAMNSRGERYPRALCGCTWL